MAHKASDSLNPNQDKAVRTTEGRVLVLAGAGSGKTKVLTHRAAFLIQEKGVPPSKILGLTFTNKAAAEMRKRLSGLIGAASAEQVTLSTFHSFCLRILREDINQLGFTDAFSIYDESDIERMVTGIAKDILGTEKQIPSLAPTMALIAKARSQGKLFLKEGAEPNWHDEFASEVLKRLGQSMRAYNALDFDSMLFFTKQLFEECPDILEKWQERFSYVMIDEYQDTSPVQYQITELLTRKSGNLCVVGDDDQSIYGWRGAHLKNILDFQYSHRITLDQNYRSTNHILKSANALIAGNTMRHEKNLWSGFGDGDPLEVFVAPDEMMEAEAIAHRIIKLKEAKGFAFRDIAILYRSNALSRIMEKALLKHMYVTPAGVRRGIPYEIVGGTEFYERREIKDLLAYLKAIVNEKDAEAIIRVINYPRRGVGDESLDRITAFSRKEKVPLMDLLKKIAREEAALNLSTQALSGVKGFLHILADVESKLKEGALAQGIEFLIERIRLKEAIDLEVKSQKGQDFKWENVQEFVTSIREFEEEHAGEESSNLLKKFVGELTLKNNLARFEGQDSNHTDAVQLMTFHSSKGLEFKACFLMGVEDHIVPHEKSVLDVGVEEERRLLYVAITRAMRYLTVSMAKERKRLGKQAVSRPSRFLFEIPKEYLKTTKWDEV